MRLTPKPECFCSLEIALQQSLNNTNEICARNGRAGLKPGAYIFSG